MMRIKKVECTMKNESSNDGAVESGAESGSGRPSPDRKPSGETGPTPPTERGRPRKVGRRPRGDTAVRQLSPEQRARVDGWLFEGELSYREVVALCQKELGTELSTAALSRYYQQELALGRRREKDSVSGYVSLMESLNEAALRAVQTVEIGNDPRTLVDIARALTAARQEANESLRATTIREKFEFDAATACLVHQVKVSSIVEDEALDDGQRIMKIREELFGPDLPE
jgi:hypothetical protein